MARLTLEKENLVRKILALTGDLKELAECITIGEIKDQVFDDTITEITRLVDEKQVVIHRIEEIDSLITRLASGLEQGRWRASLEEEMKREQTIWHHLQETRHRVWTLLGEAKELDDQLNSRMKAMQEQIARRIRETRSARQAVASYRPGVSQWGGVFVDRRE
ncbi:hypothetical protein SY88_04150 [Clostridiales bacterium PH28_bin88]|nr:hypothetical protein SY88_04150 [Clostridiales bacterium PH28_bin88]